MFQDFTGNVTLLRMIADFHVFTTDSPVAFHDFLQIGITTVTHDAFVAGGLPDPGGDFAHPWYYWRQVSMFIVASALRETRWSVDIRSGRSLKGDQRLVYITENPLNTSAYIVEVSMRLLWDIGG